MTDNTMPPGVIDELNELAQRLLTVANARERRKDEYKRQSATLKQGAMVDDDVFRDQMNEVRHRINFLLGQYWEHLVASPKKSFATMMAVFQATTHKEKRKVINPETVRATARKLGVVRKFFTMRVVWELNESKFWKWLDANPEYSSRFEDGLDFTDEHTTHTVKPNDTFVTAHATDRISNKAVSLSIELS